MGGSLGKIQHLNPAQMKRIDEVKCAVQRHRFPKRKSGHTFRHTYLHDNSAALRASGKSPVFICRMLGDSWA